MPKAYISEVEIIEEGTVVGRKAIEVNAPLFYGGYYFLQNSYDASGGPVTSVFEVRKDPGLGFAYAGFVLLFLGTVHLFYVRPLQAVLRRRSAVAGKGAKADEPAGAPGSGTRDPGEETPE